MSTALKLDALPVNRISAVFAALAKLTAMHSGLPRLEWNINADFGATGTAHGSDDDVRRIVLAWAQALRVLPDGEPAEIRIEADVPVSYVGHLVAHATFRGVEITVGGSLHDVRELAW
jgi:hypothetical protein